MLPVIKQLRCAIRSRELEHFRSLLVRREMQFIRFSPALFKFSHFIEILTAKMLFGKLHEFLWAIKNIAFNTRVIAGKTVQ